MRIPLLSLVRLAQKGAVNVGPVERAVSGALGWRLARAGFKQRGLVRGLALMGAGALLLRRGATGHCPAYARMGVVLDPARPRRLGQTPVSVGGSILVHRPRPEVYAFWRDAEQLSCALSEMDAAGAATDSQSFWTARLPGGTERGCTVRIVEEEPGARIAWETEAPSDVRHAGVLRFFDRAEGRETFVLLECTWYAPLGALGGGARQWVRGALRRIKARLEAGVVPISRPVSARRDPALAPPRAVCFEEDRAPGSALDAVEEAGLESFPASDPPSWNAGAGRIPEPSTEPAR